MQVLDDASAGLASLGWFQLGWSTYNSSNGETWPAVGDLNGDGTGEIVLGLGNGGEGYVQVRDDAVAGFAHIRWSQVPWSGYNSAVGATFPAVGDLDGDHRDELVLGLGSYPTNGGWVEIRDDLSSGLAHSSWARLHWTSYCNSNGLSRPAIKLR